MGQKSKFKINNIGRECSRCGIFKKWNLYSVDKTNKYGFTCNCLDCRNIIKREYRSSYLGKIKTSNYRIIKRSNPSFRQKEYEKYKIYREANRDKFREKGYYHRQSVTERLRKRKLREDYDFGPGNKCYYQERLFKIIDYIKMKGCLLTDGIIKIWVGKYKLKPYREKKRLIVDLI